MATAWRATQEAQARLAEEAAQEAAARSFGECSICMEEILLDHGRLALECGHLFHQGCLMAWLAGHNTCPICRAEVGGPDSGVRVVAAATGAAVSPQQHPPGSCTQRGCWCGGAAAAKVIQHGARSKAVRKKEAKADGVGNSLWGALRSRFAIASAAKQLVADANDRHQRQYSDW